MFVTAGFIAEQVVRGPDARISDLIVFAKVRLTLRVIAFRDYLFFKNCVVCFFSAFTCRISREDA